METYETPKQAEESPAGVVRRWLLELKQADKREKRWRDEAKKTWKKYRQEENAKHSFNILWSNTETLRPAVYNRLPTPDVRRRFRDEDPVGKTVSEVLSRATEYMLDSGDAHETFELSALDMLICGRAVARVRYVPSLSQVGQPEEAEDPSHESQEGDDEELEWQQATVEHVQWDDFRMGPGKCWKEVPWIAFRHRFGRHELTRMFGEVGKMLPLDDVDDEEIRAAEKDASEPIFRTAEVWEIWDKETKRVIFVCQKYIKEPLKVEDDPLELSGFFPTPKPLYAVEDSTSMVPVILYALYKQQAEELDRVSTRINKVVDAIRVRGIYDSTISELASLMKGADNDLIPAQSVSALIERGGLDKAIWMLPIEVMANVLQVLYQQREATKQVIYEITGISDILRGQTNAAETATAQNIKNEWGTLRIQRMQREVQRFIRDIVRMMAEIIGQQFLPETLAEMTGLKMPTGAEKAQMMAMAQMQPDQPGLKEQLAKPSWDDVMQVMHSDMSRQFKVDIETDSTIADTLQGDMEGLREAIGAVVEVINGIGPAIQQGSVPVEAGKALIGAVVRRARLGLVVEDAMDKIEQPKPEQTEQEQPDYSMQIAQMQEQTKIQIAQMREQAAAQTAMMKEQAAMQREQMAAQAKAQADNMQAQLDAAVKIIVANISAKAGVEQATLANANREVSESVN